MLDAGALVKGLQDMRDEGHLSDALLRYAVRSIESADDRYSWVGVYLLNEEEQELWLHNYIGSATEHARIPVGTSVGGRAVAERADLNIADVSEEEGYLANSEDVQSELVVLIRGGEDIYGQIDIASDETAAFTDDDVTAVQLVADKLAEQLAAERR